MPFSFFDAFYIRLITLCDLGGIKEHTASFQNRIILVLAAVFYL